MIDIPAVINNIRPNSEYTLNGDDYSGLVWLDEQQAKPDLAEIEQAWPSVLAEIRKSASRRSRQAAFQAESDPLFFEWQRGEGTEQAWLDKVAEIRARYPDAVA